MKSKLSLLYLYCIFNTPRITVQGELKTVVGLSCNNKQLIGHYEILENTEFVWQLPSSSIKGLVFLAHGCAHSSTDFWPLNSESCAKCIGLPVERAIVSEILCRGYIPLAISSSNREHKCWEEKDIERVARVIRFICDKLRLPSDDTIPIYAIGASSGGSFVASFGAEAKKFGLKVRAIAVQIMSLHSIRYDIPPVVFVHMSRDKRMARHIASVIPQLHAHGVVAKSYICGPKPITDMYFHEFGGVLTREESQLFATALVKAGLVDPTSRLLLTDPLLESWIPVSASIYVLMLRGKHGYFICTCGAVG